MYLKIMYGDSSEILREEVHETSRVEWWTNEEDVDILYVETDNCLLEIGIKGKTQVYLLNDSGKTIDRLV